VTSSTIQGIGFVGSNGAAVNVCLEPAQGSSPACGSATIAGGRFMIAETVCASATSWMVTIGGSGGGGGSMACRIAASSGTDTVTPADCWCRSGVGPDPGAAGAPGQGCDAGAGPTDGPAPTDADTSPTDGRRDIGVGSAGDGPPPDVSTPPEDARPQRG
jgi:hypothetical protein